MTGLILHLVIEPFEDLISRLLVGWHLGIEYALSHLRYLTPVDLRKSDYLEFIELLILNEIA